MANKEQNISSNNEFLPYLEVSDDSSIKKYIENRVINQIDWYDKKSTKNRFKYKLLMIISIIISSIIPIIVIFTESFEFIVIKAVIAGLSACIAIISSVISINQFRDFWIQYRMNCELLKSILHSFFTSSGEFSNLDAISSNKFLVSSCEKLMTDEYRVWSEKIPEAKNHYSTGS